MEQKKGEHMEINVNDPYQLLVAIKKIREKLAQEAKACAAMSENDGVLDGIIMSEIKKNEENENKKPAMLSLVFYYARAAQEERRAVDEVFGFLTGRTFYFFLRQFVIMCRTKNARAWKAKEGYIVIQVSNEAGWDYTLYNPAYELLDGGQVDEPVITAEELKDQIVKDFGWDAANITHVDAIAAERLKNQLVEDFVCDAAGITPADRKAIEAASAEIEENYNKYHKTKKGEKNEFS